MPVRVSKYEFLFNGQVTKSFESKELAYKNAFESNVQSIQHIGTTFTTI